jgi:hypothetical protein
MMPLWGKRSSGPPSSDPRIWGPPGGFRKSWEVQLNDAFKNAQTSPSWALAKGLNLRFSPGSSSPILCLATRTSERPVNEARRGFVDDHETWPQC